MTRSTKTVVTTCAVAWSVLAAAECLILPGCGGVSPAATAAAQDDAGGAGGGQDPDAGAGPEVSPQGGSGGQAGLPEGAAGSGGDSGTAGSGAAGCAPPALPVSWVLFDQATGEALDCAAAGVSDVRATATALPGGAVSTATWPCAAGSGTLPVSPGAYVVRISAEGTAFSDSRAAWVVGLDASWTASCGSAGAPSAPARIAVGAPPSCAPCASLAACCSSKMLGPCPSTCEGSYGAARQGAIDSCRATAQQLYCPGA